MLKDYVQERISKLEEMKNQAIAERGSLMIQVEAKEDYIELIDARLKELEWVEKELKRAPQVQAEEQGITEIDIEGLSTKD